MKNMTFYEKVKELSEKNPKKATLIKTSAVVGLVVVLIILIAHKPVSDVNLPEPTPTPVVEMGDVRPPGSVIEEDKEDEIPQYIGYDIMVDAGTRMRLEPMRESSYVETIGDTTVANLIAIDGEYALISHKNSTDSYTRLGYVPLDRISPISGELHPSAYTCNEYVNFTENKVRIRSSMDTDHNAGNIVVNGKKGDYGKIVAVIPGPEWSDETWYVVAYKNYIGYMHDKNGVFISTEQMQEILNRENIYLRITGTDVNFRSSPTKGQNVTTKLNSGDTASLIDENTGWYHVIFNGVEGYISKEVTCIEKYSTKSIPDGVKFLHFDNGESKMR